MWTVNSLRAVSNIKILNEIFINTGSTYPVTMKHCRVRKWMAKLKRLRHHNSHRSKKHYQQSKLHYQTIENNDKSFKMSTKASPPKTNGKTKWREKKERAKKKKKKRKTKKHVNVSFNVMIYTTLCCVT